MKIRIVLVILFISMIANAQNVTYKVLSNEPPQTPRLSISTDLIQLDVLQHTLDGMSFNASVWGHYEVLPERVGVQFIGRHSWFALGRLGEAKMPPNAELELGGYFVLRNKIRNKNTKVTLKKEYSGTTYSTNLHGESTYSYTETETFLIIPSDKKKLTMVRGGFYRKSNGNSTDYLETDALPDYFKFTSAGLYAGFNFRTLTSVFIDTDKYGVQFNSIGRDVYIDLLFLPVNSFHDLDGNKITETVKQYDKSGPLGFRLGYRLFQIDKRSKTGKMFGLCGTFEAGVKPYLGYFISSGIGITFVK
ncbi:hypothetical protein ACE01N_09055 [Saccharicrinis sp. FJH2]|uniref:hypothetical protein n=1 Tax=Saccharicrinis sp. FJH65 TaxID=3344659 RepID=UPI0035F33630